MIIGVAGPYTAATEEQQLNNLEVMHRAAATLLEMGHISLIGLDAALPVVRLANVSDPKETVMQISLSVIDACDALYLLAESPGANRERDLVLSKGLPVYYSIAEIPPA